MLVCLLWFSFTAQKVREERTNDSKLAVGVDVALATLSRMYSPWSYVSWQRTPFSINSCTKMLKLLTFLPH